MSVPVRKRLANRREHVTDTITVGDPLHERQYDAAIGFDYEVPGLPPRELFLDGAKAGTDMAFTLADVATFISIALQHGLPASLFVGSMSRVPDYGDLAGEGAMRPGSVIGAALDLIARYERAKQDVATPSSSSTSVGDGDALLSEREATHGSFAEVALIAGELREVLSRAFTRRTQRGQEPLGAVPAEAVLMVCTKIARMIAGDPGHPDHLRDMAGYLLQIANGGVLTPALIG